MPSVVFMGTPDFAAGVLHSLIDSEYEVTAVFTQPDRPKGRKGVLQMPPVKELALENGIPVYQPEKIRKEENVRILEQLKPDFIVVAAFGQIIPQSILDIPPYGCLNVHASLLPAWRGAAPIQWSILAGDQVSGVTIMRMDAGLDTGDMILKKEVAIRRDETGDSLFEVLMEMASPLLLEAMGQILDNRAVYTAQPEQSPTPYAKMLKRQSGLIDWSCDAVYLSRMVRAFDAWPGTYTYVNGKMLKIWKAEPVPEDETEQLQSAASGSDQRAAAPGEVLYVGKKDLILAAGTGALRILEVQPEGKKRMDTASFLRGYHVQTGECFGR